MKRLVLFLLCWSVLAGCDDNTIDPQPELTGVIAGYVYLHDSIGQRLTDHSGVLVQLAGETISTTTDSTGRYELNKVPSGIHKLTFSKSGYFAAMTQSVQFIGMDTLDLDPRKIFAETELGSVSLSGPSISAEYIMFTATIKPTGNRVFLTVTLSREPGSDINDKSTYVMSYPFIYDAGQSGNTIYLSPRSLREYGFGSGDRIYLTAWTTAYDGTPIGLRSNELSFVL